MQASLVSHGLASAQSRTLLSGDRVIELAWIRITDVGRRAIEGRVPLRSVKRTGAVNDGSTRFDEAAA
jgi:hypothetical protein